MTSALCSPANGNFTVELANNRAFTTLSFNGVKSTDWPDGKVHPAGWSTNMTDPAYPPTSAGCLGYPLIHAHGAADAAGTAFAISYKTDITAVNMSDFTVFSVLPKCVAQGPPCVVGGC